VTSERADEYRRLARECVAAARTVSDVQTRASLEAMAQVWFRLADEQEPQGARSRNEAGESQPVVQQQQQPQPDGDIGIGESLAAPPLPHHRTYGSVYGGSAN
jgi:hypothetical protein